MSATKDDLLPGLGTRRGVPRVSSEIDWSALVLDDRAGFILSRIDGRTSLGEIFMLAPFPEVETAAILRGLHARGVMEIPGLPRPVAPIVIAPEFPLPTAPEMTLPPKDVNGGVVEGDGGLDGDGDLPPGVCARVDEVLALIGRVDAARLLGVAPGSDKKEVRRAYFRLSKEFHPDRYFKRRLGPYKPRLQAVFNALTEAYEHLTSPKTSPGTSLKTKNGAT